jgi:hypothetical protein
LNFNICSSTSFCSSPSKLNVTRHCVAVK